MNYSDYDSDGYSSNEDVDYVPSDDNLSEDDINECEKEDPLNEDDVVPHPGDATKKKKKTKKDISVRKRKKGVLKIETVEDGTQEPQPQPQPQLLEEKRSEEDQDNEEKQKKKSDQLWASFLSDVGSRPKPSAPAAQSGHEHEADSSASKDSSHLCAETKAAEPSTVTITRVFDFAGEEVRVNKEVSADSKEAKRFLKNQEEEETSSACRGSPPPAASSKRSGSMSSILNQIGGKKQKMSTLEKSKMDWDTYKSEEGITEELAIHNRGRDGYVERKNFLERVDHRQFEREKAVRLSNMKR